MDREYKKFVGNLHGMYHEHELFLQGKTTGTKLVLEGIDLANTQYSFSGAKFQKVEFVDCDCGRKNFFDCHFDEANLSGTNFQGARFDGAVFAGANLKGTDFTNATLSNCDFYRCNYL